MGLLRNLRSLGHHRALDDAGRREVVSVIIGLLAWLTQVDFDLATYDQWQEQVQPALGRFKEIIASLSPTVDSREFMLFHLDQTELFPRWPRNQVLGDMVWWCLVPGRELVIPLMVMLDGLSTGPNVSSTEQSMAERCIVRLRKLAEWLPSWGATGCPTLTSLLDTNARILGMAFGIEK